MNILEQLAVAREIDRAEEAVSRLLIGIEAGEATGRAAEAYKLALRRHGCSIMLSGGPEALDAATDRLCAFSGHGTDRRAVLTKLWANLDATTDCDRPADLSRSRRDRR